MLHAAKSTGDPGRPMTFPRSRERNLTPSRASRAMIG